MSSTITPTDSDVRFLGESKMVYHSEDFTIEDPESPLRPMLFSIEGNIGAGKSTLINKLKEKYAGSEGIVFLQEPVNQWEQIKDHDGINMLQKFYQDPKKNAFAFQMMAYITRRDLIRDAIKNATENAIENCVIIMERSLEADRNIFVKMLRADGLLEDTEIQIYDMIAKDGLLDYGVDGVLWLMTPADECHRRIEKRGRDGENAITMEYLDNLDKFHREWLENNTKVFKIEDNDNLNVLDEFSEFIVSCDV